jgi:hypothetical protein
MDKRKEMEKEAPSAWSTAAKQSKIFPPAVISRKALKAQVLEAAKNHFVSCNSSEIFLQVAKACA